MTIPLASILLACLAQASPLVLADDGDFLRETARSRDWTRAEDPGSRWVLYSGAPAGPTGSAEAGLQALCARLDQLFGAEPRQRSGAPAAVLALLEHSADVPALCEALGASEPQLREWAKKNAGADSLLVWEPPLFALRWGDHLDGVRKPEMQVFHYAVHLEMAARHGSVPFWLSEALSYALQEEEAGGVYAVSNRGAAKALPRHYHESWPFYAGRMWTTGSVALEELLADRDDPLGDRGAYLRFGFARWLLAERAESLPALLAALTAGRPECGRDADWAPDDAVQTAALTHVLGADTVAQIAAYWKRQTPEDGPSSWVPAAATVAANVAESRKLEKASSRKVPVEIFSDCRAREVRKVMKSAELLYARLDKAFGRRPAQDGAPRSVYLLRDREAYVELCDSLAGADGVIADYMAESRGLNGFFLPHVPMTAYLDDKRVAMEARPEHSVVHILAHVELRERFGELPVWLAEGLACAIEEQTLGEVWAPCFRSGNVSFLSHDWRREAARLARDLVIRPKRAFSWHRLYAYEGRPYDPELARMAFAFSLQGLEAESGGFTAFLGALGDEYRSTQPRGGPFEIEPERIEALIQETLGENFEERFARWWKKTPRRPG